jgi:hypothetical protein
MMTRNGEVAGGTDRGTETETTTAVGEGITMTDTGPRGRQEATTMIEIETATATLAGQSTPRLRDGHGIMMTTGNGTTDGETETRTRRGGGITTETRKIRREGENGGGLVRLPRLALITLDTTLNLPVLRRTVTPLPLYPRRTQVQLRLSQTRFRMPPTRQ